MKSYDYDAVFYDGEVYCKECLPEGINTDDYDPIFAGSEWDFYPSCTVCGAVHDYVSLTEEGRNQIEIDEVLCAYERGEFDGLVVDDLSAVPEEYDGAILDINDHGNVTLYITNCGQFKEIASRV